MKRFSAPSIDHIVRSAVPRLATACLVLALVSTSCVSDPESAPVPEDTVAAAVPDVVASMRSSPPGEESAEAPLAEPPFPEPVAAPVAAPVSTAAAELPIEPVPTDITVLSAAPSIAFEPVRLPEPVPPAPVAPAAAAPAPKPVAKTAPAATPPAKPAIPAKPAPTPKPVAEAAAPVEAAVPEPKPAVALPPTPASSARSVVAAERPVAETRIETTRGEKFELRFPGTGWIYLGDEDGKEGVRYETRRFEDTQAVFALDPESPGEYLLRFQRQNPVDRATETSLVRVVVTEKPAASATPATAPPAAAASGTAPSPVTAPVAASPATVPAPAVAPASETSAQATISAAAGISDPAALIRLAKTELEAKRVQSAIEALDRYLSLYPYGNDEVFYLYGLACEQDTPFRNVKKAYEYYKRVKDEYPRSPRWREASDKVAYLERHFFGLR